MGVTQLWQILAPVQQHRPLSSLAGQTLAVDLSIWVCETQSVKQMQGVVSKPFLRNLFFRICHLTQLGVKLVFAIEGTAPELKWEAMMKRQQVRYGDRPGGHGARPGKQTRRNFNTCLKECCELLDVLGIPYVQSCGEAEAMCAVLNAVGLVDGCLTNDGDAFLYGATMVYRNFTMNSKDPHVESYSMVDIQDQLGIDRDSLVGLGLLLGCDYVPKGVPGVGMANAVKLLQSLSGHNILKRFKSWRGLPDGDCVDKVEMSIRRKALAVKEFPQNKVIAEFLVVKDRCPSSLSPWKRPHVSKFQKFALVKLEWPVEYGLEKILPLVTLWDMGDILSPRSTARGSHLKPHRIVKTRVRQGVPCLEVEWHKPKTDTTHPDDFYVTIETQEMFVKCFPRIYEEFSVAQELKKSKKPSKGKSRKKAAAASNIATTDPLSGDPIADDLQINEEPEPDTEVAAVKLTHMDELSDSLGNLNLTAMYDGPISSHHEIGGVKPEKPNLLNKDSRPGSIDIGSLFPYSTVEGSPSTNVTKLPVQNSVLLNMDRSKQTVCNEHHTLFNVAPADSGIGIMGTLPADDSVSEEVIPLHLRIMNKMNKNSIKEKLKCSGANILSTKMYQTSTKNTQSTSPGNNLNAERNFSTITNNGMALCNKSESLKNAPIYKTIDATDCRDEIYRDNDNKQCFITNVCDIHIENSDNFEGEIDRYNDPVDVTDDASCDGTATNISVGNDYASPSENHNTRISETDKHTSVSCSEQMDSNSPTYIASEKSPCDVLCYNTPGNESATNVSYGHFYMSGLCNTLNFSNHSLLNVTKITDTSTITNETEIQLSANQGNSPKEDATTVSNRETSAGTKHGVNGDKYEKDPQGNRSSGSISDTLIEFRNDFQLPVSNNKSNSGQDPNCQICDKFDGMNLEDNSVIVVNDLNYNVRTIPNKLGNNKTVKCNSKLQLPPHIDVKSDLHKPVCGNGRNMTQQTAVEKVKINHSKDVCKNVTDIYSETTSKKHKLKLKSGNRKQRKYLVEKASPLMDFSDDDDDNLDHHNCINGSDSVHTEHSNPFSEVRVDTDTGTQIIGSTHGNKGNSGSNQREKQKPTTRIKKASPVMDFSADNTVLMADSKDSHGHKMSNKGTGMGHSVSTKPVIQQITGNSSKTKRAPVLSLNKMKNRQTTLSEENEHAKVTLISECNLNSNVDVQFKSVGLQSESAGSHCRNAEPQSECFRDQSFCNKPQSGNAITVLTQCNIGLESASVEPHSDNMQVMKENVESEFVGIGQEYRSVDPHSVYVEQQLESVAPQSGSFHPPSTSVKPSTTELYESDGMKGENKVIASVIKDTNVSLDVGSPVSLSQRLKLRLKDSSTRKVLQDFTNL